MLAALLSDACCSWQWLKNSVQCLNASGLLWLWSICLIIKNISHYICKWYLLTSSETSSSIVNWIQENINVFYWSINHLLGFKRVHFISEQRCCFVVMDFQKKYLVDLANWVFSCLNKSLDMCNHIFKFMFPQSSQYLEHNWQQINTRVDGKITMWISMWRLFPFPLLTVDKKIALSLIILMKLISYFNEIYFTCL